MSPNFDDFEEKKKFKVGKLKKKPSSKKKCTSAEKDVGRQKRIQRTRATLSVQGIHKETKNWQ